MKLLPVNLSLQNKWPLSIWRHSDVLTSWEWPVVATGGRSLGAAATTGGESELTDFRESELHSLAYFPLHILPAAMGCCLGLGIQTSAGLTNILMWLLVSWGLQMSS